MVDITGRVKMESGKGGGSDEVFLKIGMVTILLCWILLLIWTLISLRPYQKDTDAAAYADGTKVSASRPSCLTSTNRPV
jgi:hypothetical protein